MINDAWFLLFDGNSPDGRGQPKYVGRTTDEKTAAEHYAKVSSNPYSTGEVVVVTDEEYELYDYWKQHHG